MPKATIREDDQIFASGSHPESLTLDFHGMSMTEWDALSEEEKRDFREYGAD